MRHHKPSKSKPSRRRARATKSPAKHAKRTRRVKRPAPPRLPALMVDNLLVIYGCFGRDRVQVNHEARTVTLDGVHDLSWLVYLQPMADALGEPYPPLAPSDVLESLSNLLPDSVQWLTTPSEDAESLPASELRRDWNRWQVCHGEIAPGGGAPNPVWPRVTRVLEDVRAQG